MKDLSEHQRSILIAMLQGKRIEKDHYMGMPPIELTPQQVLIGIVEYPHVLHVIPTQSEAVRLYGTVNDEIGGWFVRNHHKTEDAHYIDICPNGFIVGGKIEEAK